MNSPTNRLMRRLALAAPALLGFGLLPSVGAQAPAVGVGARDYTVTLPDPKLPSRPQLVAHIRDFTGQVTDATLNGVYAQLYQRGRPAAIVAAPRAVLHRAAAGLVMTATGGVTAKSLLHPGTRLSSDTMVWHAGQNTIVATGHVFYKDSKSGAVVTGPYAVWDIKTQTLNTRGPGRASAIL